MRSSSVESLAAGDRAVPERPVLAGLVSGSTAAVVASLVSLPLRSPDDILFNSATVTVGALFAGLAAGALWRVLSGRNRYTAFGVLWLVGFGLVAAAALLAQTKLDRVIPYALPLAAIAFPVIGVGTLAGRSRFHPEAVGGRRRNRRSVGGRVRPLRHWRRGERRVEAAPTSLQLDPVRPSR